jgi:hypothetical protein
MAGGSDIAEREETRVLPELRAPGGDVVIGSGATVIVEPEEPARVPDLEPLRVAQGGALSELRENSALSPGVAVAATTR